MKKLFFLFFLGLSVFVLSCSDNTSDPCKKCTTDQYCLAGSCRYYACSDEHKNGACKHGQHCDDGQCIVSICSKEFPRGTCDSADEHCVSGVCEEYSCSRSHPTGACSNGEVCLTGGKCGNPSCSSSNTSGTCPAGQECSSAGNCELLPCSKDTPNGKCENSNNECVEGICLSKNRCTSTNANGTCPQHQKCEEGICKDVDCGVGNPDGKCPEGQYCDRKLEAGDWVFACKDIATSCNENSECPDGYKCENNLCVEYVCDPACTSEEICKYGTCQDDSFFCGVDSPNGWCEEGYECINGNCEVPVSSPCDGSDCGNDFCIVTDWNSSTGYECVSEADLCSENNMTGKCNAPLICKAGVCSQEDLCKDVTCNENQICDSSNGTCIDNYCKLHANICTEEHTICVNLFTGPDNYQCQCELGYEYSLTEDKCILKLDACTNKDCGEGICITDKWEQDGWMCVCNTGMKLLDENIKHLCIDPATYDYCSGWDCGVGSCNELTNDDGSKFAICNCPENFIFDSIQKTCVPGIVCGNTICNNPLREKCINNQFCESQPCNSNYPEGTCGNAETCIEGSCILTEECSAESSAGYCMDGYSCKSGICCRGGNCSTTDSTLKLVGETCKPRLNNCVNDAICIPTPTGDGVCHKLCDQTDVSSCSDLNIGETIYHCIGRNVFDGVNYNKIGVCAVDDNCSKSDNGGCQTNQVCLGFRRTPFTKCYAFEANTPLGASCTTGTTTMGFNVGCAENLLCVDGTCVPNCDNEYRISSPEINLCYEPFTGKYKIDNLNVKGQDSLTFNSKKSHNDISTCNPNVNNTCTNGLTCVKVQDKDSSVGSSKDLGLCTQSCNFDSSNYKNECGGTDICFKSNNNSICLGDSNCNPVTSSGCAGDEVCYPITSTLNSCMTTMGMGHPGEECTGACQYGLCINGICSYPCSIGDNTSCDSNNGETCQDSGDAYLNNSSHFGSPSVYGTCQ